MLINCWHNLLQMGGHGGLNILPQKKWNVYNWDNREIVDKDKKIHAEKLQREYEDQRDSALDRKLEVLKGDNVPQVSKPQYRAEDRSKNSLINNEMRKLAEEHKHVNLFEEEERILMNREMSEIKRLKEEQFLKDKNMDFSTRFLGSYAAQDKLPWYSRKKGAVTDKPKNKNYKHLDDVIYGVKSDSKVTKEVIQAEKRLQRRTKEENSRDRTREKIYSKYEDYEAKCSWFGKQESKPIQDLVKHQQDLMLKQFKSQQAELESRRHDQTHRKDAKRSHFRD